MIMKHFIVLNNILRTFTLTKFSRFVICCSPLPFRTSATQARWSVFTLPSSRRICCDPWLAFQFSVLMRQLFEEYNNMVSTVNVEEFCRTVLGWLEQHCSLPALRPGEFISDFVTNSYGESWDSFCAKSWVMRTNPKLKMPLCNQSVTAYWN